MAASTGESAAEFVPDGRDLATLREAAGGCRGCPLYANATQTVFGAGGADARLMLVGEQPGDREDREGEPFVGPAGAILDRALESAGIQRELAYVTNAVKHFKWRPRGTRRIHATPRVGEIEACKPWLEAEVEAVSPEGILAMGATAARAVFGPSVKVTRDRGRLLDSPLAEVAAVTIHPSAILRVRDKIEREDALGGLVADLALVDRALKSGQSAANP
jgi:uracil-DNA glycosylase family protein